MSERFGGPSKEMPSAVSAEQARREEQEKEDQAYLDLYKRDHPKAFEMPDVKREGEAELAEFEAAVDAYESEHPMDELFAVTDLDPKEAPNHAVREAARMDLSPIFALMKKITKETKLTPEQAAQLKKRWKRISNAVGVINDGKVDHNR